METLGQFLAREREFRGINLEKFSKLTRINLSVLRQMEGDRFGGGPHTIYMRGFLRSYAKHLELNVDEILGRYKALASPAPVEVASAKPDLQPKTSRVLLIIACLSLAVALAAYLTSR